MSRVPLVLSLVLVLAGCYSRGEDKPTGIPGVNKIPHTRIQALDVADRLEALYQGKTRPESVRMLLAIAHGRIDRNNGWFGPAQTRYDWPWLARRCNADPKEGIPREKFPGTNDWFASLDRNKDGVISQDDITAGPPEPFVLPVPSPEILLRSLFASELGSLQEGPALGAAAPDFELPTVDGKEKRKLSNLIGKKANRPGLRELHLRPLPLAIQPDRGREEEL